MSTRIHLDYFPHKTPELYLQAQASLKAIYANLGAQANDNFYLTAQNGEAVQHVFMSTYFDVVRETGRNHFITTATADMSTLASIAQLEKLGCVGKLLPVNRLGQLTRDALLEALRPKSALVSLSWADGLTGVIQPITELVQACREKEVRCHIDATHVIGKLYFRFEDLGADYLSLNNAVFVKGGMPLSSHLGALDTQALTELKNALEKAMLHFDHLCTETARLRDKLERGIQASFPDALVLFAEAERLPHCSAIAFPGVAAEALHFMLSRQNIYANLDRLAHTLTACGVEPLLANSALSFALAYDTQEKEIDRAVEIIAASAKKLKSYSAGLFI